MNRRESAKFNARKRIENELDRMTCSPWPTRVENIPIYRTDDNAYLIKGETLSFAQALDVLLATYEKRSAKRQAYRRERDDLYSSLNMSRVRGNLGGVYYE